MSDNQTSNGGGYGNPGGDAQSQYQAQAQQSEASAPQQPNQAPQGQAQYDSPSSQMAQDFAQDGEVSSQPSPVADQAVDGTGVGLHNQSEAFRSQTQIAYQDGSSAQMQGYDESADYGEEE